MPFVAPDGPGRLHLPRELREQLNFTCGSAFYLEARDGYLYVAPIDDPYVLMPHDEFLATAKAYDAADRIENYPELLAEIAQWDQTTGDGLDAITAEEAAAEQRAGEAPRPRPRGHTLPASTKPAPASR